MLHRIGPEAPALFHLNLKSQVVAQCFALLSVFVIGAATGARADDPVWAICFDLTGLRRHLDPIKMRSLLWTDHEAVDRCEEMIMTPERNYFFCSKLCEVPSEVDDCSIVEKLHQLQSTVSGGPSLLFGMARDKRGGRIALHVGQDGRAVASLPVRPDLNDVHLLSIVGVDLKEVIPEEGKWKVIIDHRLQDHLALGNANAGFCTKYFADGMRLDSDIRSALFESLMRRVEAEREEINLFIDKYFEEYTVTSHLMRRQPSGFPIGNVAPYGLVLPSLADEKATAVRERLGRLEREGLFPFSDGYSATLADACLALEHLDEVSSAGLLKLRTETGGFLPQSCDGEYPDEMIFWCQEDYGFSAWAQSILARDGLASHETHAYLLENIERRASLFIANPLFVNYLTARGLRVYGLSEERARELVEDTLSYVNSDYSFGDFDKSLSTVLALSTLSQCGYFGPQFVRGVIYLLRQCHDGDCGPSTPYYSAVRRDGQYVLTFYEDEGLILSSLIEQFLKGLSCDAMQGFTKRVDALRRPKRDQRSYVVEALETYR